MTLDKERYDLLLNLEEAVSNFVNLQGFRNIDYYVEVKACYTKLQNYDRKRAMQVAEDNAKEGVAQMALPFGGTQTISCSG